MALQHNILLTFHDSFSTLKALKTEITNIYVYKIRHKPQQHNTNFPTLPDSAHISKQASPSDTV